VEPSGKCASVGRPKDDLADRPCLVVDETELGLERGVVERARADQADLLLEREDELDARVLPPLLDDPPRGVEHRDDGALVVAAENRAARIADDPVVVDERLQRPLRRHRVEVGTEEEGCAAVRAARQAAEEIAGVRADARARVVLLDLEP
jgi:hypothetical protein